MIAMSAVFAQVLIAQEAAPAAKDAPASKEMDRLGVSAEQPENGPFVKIEGGFMVPYETAIPGNGREIPNDPSAWRNVHHGES